MATKQTRQTWSLRIQLNTSDLMPQIDLFAAELISIRSLETVTESRNALFCSGFRTMKEGNVVFAHRSYVFCDAQSNSRCGPELICQLSRGCRMLPRFEDEKFAQWKADTMYAQHDMVSCVAHWLQNLDEDGPLRSWMFIAVVWISFEISMWFNVLDIMTLKHMYILVIYASARGMNVAL